MVTIRIHLGHLICPVNVVAVALLKLCTDNLRLEHTEDALEHTLVQCVAVVICVHERRVEVTSVIILDCLTSKRTHLLAELASTQVGAAVVHSSASVSQGWG